MSQDFTYATVIVPDADRATAQKELGDGFFNVPASATGELPAQAWFTSGPCSNDEMDIIANEVTWKKKMYFGQDWQAALDAQGLQMIVPVEKA